MDKYIIFIVIIILMIFGYYLITKAEEHLKEKLGAYRYRIILMIIGVILFVLSITLLPKHSSFLGIKEEFSVRMIQILFGMSLVFNAIGLLMENK